MDLTLPFAIETLLNPRCKKPTVKPKKHVMRMGLPRDFKKKHPKGESEAC